MLLYLDSYDHYSDLTQKWDANGTASVDMTGNARTGIGCCLCQPPLTPELNVPNQVGAVVGSAYKSQGLIGDIFGLITGTGVFRVRQVRLAANNDGSVSVLAGNDPFFATLGTSAPNLLSVNNYAYCEMKVLRFDSATGAVTVRINGQTVLNLTGVDTDPGASGTYNTFYIYGAGGGNLTYHDDTYLLNLVDSGVSGQPNNDFIGAIRNYAQVPTANASPLDWTPKAGTNFSEVNTIPPPGDTSYVFAGIPGNEDQYVYGTTGITPPVSVVGVQVCLCAKLDAAGTRSIAADVGGVMAPGTAITNTYHMVKDIYDGNPVDSKAWQLTDFGSVRFGPAVTA